MAPAAAAREALESLLRERRLDSTLTSARPFVPPDEEALAPTGLQALDHHLLGGLPRGQLSEITGPRSSGRTSVLFRLIAQASRGGELVALVDTLDRFDPASADAAGVDLTQVLWIRGQDVPLSRSALAPGWEPARARSGHPRRTLVAQALDRAIKALNLVLQAGGFGLVAIDLADVPLDVIKGLPFTTWLRLQRVLEGSPTACIIVAADGIARSAGGVSVRLSPRQADRPAEPANDAGAPLMPTGVPRPRSGGAEAFHAAVRASRRPFSPRPQPIAAGHWTGPSPHTRRFRGLSSRAAVVRAERRAQSDAHVLLDFGG
jgi:recombination protein RecA